METLKPYSRLRQAREAADKREILRVLFATKGNRQWAAEILGVNTIYLYRLIKRYGIDKLVTTDGRHRRTKFQLAISRLDQRTESEA